MFFATSRLGSRKQRADSTSLDLHEVTEELTHPSSVLFTEEVILGICMVITGLLYAFAQMPNTVLTTATAGKTLMKRSVAGFAAAPIDADPARGHALITAAQPMLQALRRANELEQQADFGPGTQAAWQDVLAELDKLRFTLIAMPDQALPLWMLEAELDRAVILEARLESQLGHYREAIESLRRADLSPEQIAALAVPADRRSHAQAALAAEAEESLQVPWAAVVPAVPDGRRAEAENICRLLEEARQNATSIARYREIINYDHWMAAARMAATPEGLQARAALSRADRAVAAGDFEAAEVAYEEGLTAWQASLIANPQLAERPAVAEELGQRIAGYQKVLEELGRPFDATFSLQNMLQAGL